MARKDFILPMRNWNFVTSTWRTLSAGGFYLTYEELKLLCKVHWSQYRQEDFILPMRNWNLGHDFHQIRPNAIVAVVRVVVVEAPVRVHVAHVVRIRGVRRAKPRQRKKACTYKAHHKVSLSLCRRGRRSTGVHLCSERDRSGCHRNGA